MSITMQTNSLLCEATRAVDHRSAPRQKKCFGPIVSYSPAHLDATIPRHRTALVRQFL